MLLRTWRARRAPRYVFRACLTRGRRSEELRGCLGADVFATLVPLVATLITQSLSETFAAVNVLGGLQDALMRRAQVIALTHTILLARNLIKDAYEWFAFTIKCEVFVR